MGKASRRRRTTDDQGAPAKRQRTAAVPYVNRPFEGLPQETEWVAIREILPAATVAADLLAGWGADAVGATIERLNARIEDGVRDLDVVVPPRALRGPHMLGIRLPGGAPPAVAFEWDAGRVPPLAPVRRSIPAARLASLIGAPLPPRGPPAVS